MFHALYRHSGVFRVLIINTSLKLWYTTSYSSEAGARTELSKHPVVFLRHNPLIQTNPIVSLLQKNATRCTTLQNTTLPLRHAHLMATLGSMSSPLCPIQITRHHRVAVTCTGPQFLKWVSYRSKAHTVRVERFVVNISLSVSVLSIHTTS